MERVGGSELLVNVNSEYVYAFPDIAFVPGTLKAVATKNGKVVAQQELHAGKLNTTNNKYLDTNCGINRVAIRSTLTPGIITVTAKREGLTSATVTIESKPVEIIDGLTLSMPQTLPVLKRNE